MVRRPLVAANWKMHGMKAEVAALTEALTTGLSAGGKAEVLVCPPFVFLSQVQRLLAESAVMLGAQNMHQQEKGAFTGEISASMLLDHGCRYVILGHSERREIFAESDALVASKFQAALQAGLAPILCVGESEEQRQSGITEAVIRKQLQAVLDEVGVQAFASAVIAYEPVWAIGTGLTASPEQAQSVHSMIRSTIAEQQNAGDLAEGLRILYGGSVKAANADALFAQPDIDGALVGGASLDAKEFLSICQSAEQVGS